MSGPESVLPPGASSGMSDILLRTSCCKISLPLRNAPGGSTDSGTTNTYSRHSSQTCSGADANLVARQSRALIWRGRSQSSGLTNFPIRLSERSRNLTPLCRVNAGPALVLLFRTFRRTEEAPQRVARSGASDMSEDVLKSNTRPGPDENNRLQVDVRFLDRERLGEVARAAVARGNFLKLRKLLGADALRDRTARVETAAGRRI